jgi:KDO2-lipid IV(A) lauroyltransferase
MTLAPRLARTGATVILAWAERLPQGAGYHLHLSKPVGDVATPADVKREIERLVRLCPGQYLWGYNRYKVPRGVPAP